MVTVKGGETTELEIRLAERTTRLGGVSITAEKKEQSVQEIPSSISVISTEQIPGPGGTEADLTPLPLATSAYGQPGFTAPGYHNDVWSEEISLRLRGSYHGAIVGSARSTGDVAVVTPMPFPSDRQSYRHALHPPGRAGPG